MHSNVKFLKLGAWLLGFFNFVSFASIAQIVLVEVIAISSMIFVPLRKKSSKFEFNKEYQILYILGVLWLIGQILSNFLNRSDGLESIKSIAQICVLLTLLYWGFYWARKNPQILSFYLWGYIVSSIPEYFFSPGLYGSSDPWKFIFGPAITLMATLSIPRISSSKGIVSILFFPLVLMDFLLGARSLGLITLFTAVMFLQKSFKQRGKVYSLLFLIFICILLQFTYSVYANLASTGRLGASQYEKFERQSQAGPLLFVARSELLYELSAIRKNALLGLGGSPSVDQNFLQGVALEEFRFGVNHKSTAAYYQYTMNGKIPSHSMIFGAWMEAGVLGALFWLYLTWLVFRNLLTSTGREPVFGLTVRYLSINFLWAVFFSPLGARSRVLIAITITLVIQASILKAGEDASNF